MKITINAKIENIVYSNPDNGYTVCEVDSDEEGQFYAVGFMPSIAEGEDAALTGSWVSHAEYGEQFKVEFYEAIMPSTETSIIKYLGSGVIKGVREATAKQLYARFGKDVFNVLATKPEEVATVKGISKKRADGICNSFREHMAVQNIIMFLQQYGVSPNLAIKINKLWGADAVARIKENPYTLAMGIDGITFRVADNIAFSMGLPKNSTSRIKCGLIYFLREAAYSNGHTYLPRALLTEHTMYQLKVSETEVENALSELCAERDIMITEIEKEPVCYLYAMYYDEKYIAQRLRSISVTKSKYSMSPDRAAREIDEMEREEGIRLAPEQRDAVSAALSGGCAIITGGPGTGKTTTVNTIIALFEKLRLKIALVAPTGRAAKRMTQVTGREAKTIHRLLGAQPAGGTHIFSHNEENPLTADVVILDEVSMVDTQLMASFLRALKRGTIIIFSGDSDQLPAVGAGNVLRDMIDSRVVPVVRLTKIFRQSEESLIIVNAHRINRGEQPELRDRTRDFFFMRRGTPQEAAETIAQLYSSRLPHTYGINAVSDIQVLAPTKKSIAGTVELNKRLQLSVNPPSPEKKEYKYGNTVFREGDKVMQIKNNYDMPYTEPDGDKNTGIYNGDMGIIDSIHTTDKYMLITFDETKAVQYPLNGLDELDLAYAITVHKSQGSEFPYVIMPVCGYIPMLMSRNLFYTAITRAKTMVILVGSERTIVNMTNNNSYTKRFTGLRERLDTTREESLENGVENANDKQCD